MTPMSPVWDMGVIISTLFAQFWPNGKIWGQEVMLFWQTYDTMYSWLRDCISHLVSNLQPRPSRSAAWYWNHLP